MFSESFWRFLGYALPYWRISLVSVLLGLCKFTLALLLPWALGMVVKYAIDPALTPSEQLQHLALILAALVGAFLLRAPITFYRTYMAEWAGNRTIFDIRGDLYRHIQRLSLSYHGNQRTGSTISRLINDINAAQGILDRGVITAVIDLFFLAGVVVYLFIVDWRLAAVSLVTLPLYGFVIAYINPKLRKAATEAQERVSEMSGEVTEKLAGLPVVISFVREKTEQLHFFTRHRGYLDKIMGKTRIQSGQIAAMEFFTAAGPLVVVGYGGWRVITGTLELHEFIWFYGFISHLYLPTRRLADCSAIVQERLAAMDRVFELFDEVPDIADGPEAKPLRITEGRIEFRNVDFAYESRDQVLHGISFTAEPGQSVALVGRSGAGKSTIANLVPRFYDVSLGEILVDGQNVRDVKVKSLREHIGVVMQDPILFSGTIRENILYGRRGASEREMFEAARMAHVDEFANDLPMGYDTVIGERGLKLSGGQKQRVAIARAFLRNPRILILDEATSNLDSQAENIIQDALSKLMQGRTTLVIAHRLSTIADCDKIVVIEQGRLVQQGNHDELLLQPGVYRRLCEEQFGYVRLEGLG